MVNNFQFIQYIIYNMAKKNVYITAAIQSSALANSLVEELTIEKNRLSNELYTLRAAKEMITGGSSLAEVVVELRRKISTLELLQKVFHSDIQFKNFEITSNILFRVEIML